MPQRFQLFRLSLLKRIERTLFVEGPDPTREEYLRHVFSHGVALTHYQTPFHYQPDPTRSGLSGLIGRLGRAVVLDENRPPEEGLEEASHETWKAAILVLDPTDHEDGQKLSLEIDPQVGKPMAILGSLIHQINETNPDSPYTIEAEPIFDPETFWDFASENAGQITSLTFEFVAPNGLWGTADKLKAELRAAREKTGAQKIINTFKSEDGLKTDDEGIAEAVDYAMSGSGEIRAKAKNGAKFNSTMRPKTVSLPDDDTEEALIVRVARQIAAALGRP